MLTWTAIKAKMQRLAKDPNSDVLTQLSEDWNTGYHMFNQKLARYYTRKQQFTNLIAGQQIYQTPVDCIRIMVLSSLITGNYELPVQRVSDEYEWRSITGVKNYKSNWQTYYFMQGRDLLSVWPIPSQNVTNGLRFVYQPQDHDLSVDDTTSATTGLTVTVANGSATVTADSGSPFTADMAGLMFQVIGQADLTFYTIQSASATALTLRQAYTAASGSGKSWRIGQVSIIPQEYQDAPMHYALGNFFSANGNESRALFHLGTPDKPGQFYTLINECKADYSMAAQSSIITEQPDEARNIWLAPPPAA